MKGTGIETDPYLIETWTDFFDESAHGTNVYCMLANDLDGNELNNGIFPSGNAVPANLDGNGKSIRNLYNMDDGINLEISGKGIWKNLTIESVITTGAVFTYDGVTTSYKIQFQKCTISVKCLYFISLGGADFTECTLSMILGESMKDFGSRGGSVSMNRCSLYCTIQEPSNNWNNFDVKTSRIEMQVNKMPADGGTFAAENSIIAVKMPDGESGVNFVFSGNSLFPSVMDATLWGNNSTEKFSGIILLPTESMKNADALNAAGFVAARVS